MIKEVVIQTRPEGADHWDPGVTCILEGAKSKDEALRYIWAKIDETATQFHKELARKERTDKNKD